MHLKTVFRVTFVYLVFGILWIYFSDSLLERIFSHNVALLSKLQTFKGLIYVGVTALLLHFLVKRHSKELQLKITRLQESEQELIRSEQKYKTLFESSPMPVFIYQPETDKILDINNAAIAHYGYTQGEFSSMTILQIEHDEDVALLESKLNLPKRSDMAHSTGIHRHKKKDGELIYVYTQGTDIDYKGIKAQIIIANDITRQLRYIDAVEKQNEKLNEIAWMQSHVVRAPLASLMGLIHLLKDEEHSVEEKEEILDKMLISANELDLVIREITNSADTTEYSIDS